MGMGDVVGSLANYLRCLETHLPQAHCSLRANDVEHGVRAWNVLSGGLGYFPSAQHGDA